ncbi:MAG: hypothetical protein ABIO05_07375 [Ferruginibacter sp.]
MKHLLCILVITMATLSGKNVYSQSSFCTKKIDSILKTPTGVISVEHKKQIRDCVYELQNIGFLLDEIECKYDSARIKLESALKVWQHINDTLNQANLLKFLGYLNGRLQNFQIGKSQIGRAIELYNSKKDSFGVAVSYFNLSRINEFENELDSAVLFAEKAKAFWQHKNNPGRLMILNNQLINLKIKQKKRTPIGYLINENTVYLKSGIYWQQQLDFYFLSEQYFTKMGNREKKAKYAALYSNKIESLAEENSQTSYSIFDKRHCN